MTQRSSIRQKVTASTVNCTLVFTASLPFYLTMPLAVWRLTAVLIFFAYNMIFRERCIGMMVAGTTMERPTSWRYAVFYTFSFTSLLWYVAFPLDVALLYGVCVQYPCVMLTGNTPHGYLADQRTYA